MTEMLDAARLGRRAGYFWLAVSCVMAGPSLAQDAAALHARHAALRESLVHSSFGRPLHLESIDKSGDLAGDVYARVAQPFDVVRPALRDIGAWCDIMMLHPNVKGCSAAGETLDMNVGRKSEQAPADAYPLQFKYAVAVSGPDYLRVVLRAPRGPLGTRHYRIVLEATGLADGSSFLHLSYGYASGAASRLATGVYLATVGRAKIGFSVVGRTANGGPVYIGGTRGMVERNAMRCYLAIDAYLDALSAPAAEQVERRLVRFHAGVEQYAAQLHELELGEYLAMKRVEIRRQQAADVSPSAQTLPADGDTLGQTRSAP